MPGTKRKNNHMQHRVHSRSGVFATATALSLLLPAAAAWADGQIKFKVVNSKTGEPLPGAVIVIKAGPTDLEDMQFSTASNGLVTTDEITSGTREYSAKALVAGIGFKEVKGKVVVVDDQTVDVELKLDPVGEITKVISGKQLRIDVLDHSVYTFRDREQLQFFPNGVGNQQSLSKALRSVPGMVPNSLNRLHSRGEADTGTYLLDGFQLPSLLAGRASNFITPDMIDSVKVRTGGLEANLGGSSTVLDTSLKAAISAGGSPLEPALQYSFNAEDYGGSSQSVTFSRQLNDKKVNRSGRIVPNPDSRAGFVLSFARRENLNFFESPQPQRQMAGNSGNSNTLFGKFSYRLNRLPGKEMEASAFFGLSDGSNRVSNRQGLTNQFSTLGHGFGGNKTASQLQRINFQDGTSFPQSQVVLGNQVSQTDENLFFALQVKKTFSPLLKGTISLGGAKTKQGTNNSNILGFPLTTGAAYSPANLPEDYSIEYNPTTSLDFNQNQVQADFTFGSEKTTHNYKFGLVTQSLSGNEGYQFVPMSNAALNAALNINGFLTNSLRVNNDNSWPTMRINRSGSFSAFYVQDTFVPFKSMRVSLGARMENFEQTQRLSVIGSGARPDITSKRSQSSVSPRFNVLYMFPNGVLRSVTKGQPTVVRFGYNKIFTPPGIGQGAIGTGQVGGAVPLPVAAQTNNQLDFSIEQQMKNQAVRLSTYNKSIGNLHQWQQMIQGPQAGAYMMVNSGSAKVNGMELLYEVKPREYDPRPGQLEPMALGLSGYLSLANSKATRSAAGGGSVAIDWDQQQTVNLGLGYQLINGAKLSFAYYRGSGLASSATTLGGSRAPINQLDMHFRTQSKLISNLHSVEIGIENMTNSRSPLNFHQGALASNSMGGTRFLQGRRLVLGLSGKF